jgi:hypothetical protein
MTDFHVTVKGGELDDAEVRRRLAVAYQIVLEACRRGEAEGEEMAHTVKGDSGTLSHKGGKVQDDGT